MVKRLPCFFVGNVIPQKSKEVQPGQDLPPVNSNGCKRYTCRVSGSLRGDREKAGRSMDA